MTSDQAGLPPLYWCIGLYASGSTWLFNAGKKIAASCGLANGLASVFVSQQCELIFPPGTRTAIVKTHETDPAAARLLITHARAIWLSLRDPRDCVASLMRYQACSFDEALDMVADAAAACLPLLHHSHATIFRFEDNFFDLPETLDTIATGLRCALSAADRARIYAETRRSAIEALIARFHEIPTVVGQPEPGHLVDVNTQWHTHHAGRDGMVGRWHHALTEAQVVRVERRLGGAMERMGYRPSR
jgi:hypothetical protein